MSSTTQPAAETIATPLRRDWMVLAWIGGTTVSWFGDAAWTVALAWTAVHTMSAVGAGAIIGVEMFPQAALMLLGGVIADRFDPRRVQVVGQLTKAAALLTAALAWSAGLTGPLTLAALALTFGVASGLTIPAGAALVRQLVPSDELGTVSGVNQISGRIARLVGAPAGGLLVAWQGVVAVMVINAVTFLVIAIVLVLVVQQRYPSPRATHARWRDTFLDGVSYLRDTPAARLFVIGLTALNVFVTPITALGLALRVSESGWGAHWLGVADGALAAGAIVGSLAGIRWQPIHGAVAGFRVLVVQGLGLAAVGLAWLPVVVAGMAVVGLTAGMASVWLSGSFLRTVAPSHIGRVSSVTSLGDMALTPLSLPALGAIAAASSVATATVGFGIVMSLLCGWFATRTIIQNLT